MLDRCEVPTPTGVSGGAARGDRGRDRAARRRRARRASASASRPSSTGAPAGCSARSTSRSGTSRSPTSWAARFGVPVVVENDANVAALAEWKLGAGRGKRSLVMLTLGTGVGGGVVLDGALYRGWAELGHAVVVADGPPCQGTCTGRGHLEAVASGNAADRAAVALWGEGATAELLVDRAETGDEAAIEALTAIGRLLGAGDRDVHEHLRARARRRRRRLRPGRVDVPLPAGARGRPARGARAGARRLADRRRRSSAPTQASIGAGLRRARGARRCRSRSARRRSATSRTSRCACPARACRGRARPLRGHAPDEGAARPARRRGDAAQLPPAQRGARGRRSSLPRLEAGERIALVSDAGPARRQRPGRAADRGGARGGRARDRAAGRVRRRDGARRERARRRAVPVPRLPAARRAGARGAVGRARRLAASGGRVRVAAAAPGDAALARGGAAGPAGRRLSRADEALRGGRARDRLRRSRPGSRSRRRGRSRSSSARARVSSRATPARRMRSPRSSSSSRPDCRAVRPPTSSPGWRAFPVTPCTRNRCKRAEPCR